MLDLLMTSTSVLTDKDEQGRELLLVSGAKKTKRHSKPCRKGIGQHAILCNHTRMTIWQENLNVIALLKTCSTSLRSCSVRHLLLGWVPCC